MMEILGYADRWSVKPGDRLTVHVSCTRPGRFRADIIRLLGGSPAGDPYAHVEEDVASAIAGEYDGYPQRTLAGSHAIVPSDPRFDDPMGLALDVLIWPTLTTGDTRNVFARRCGDAGFVLLLDEGHPVLRIGETIALRAPVALTCRRWYRLHARIDVAADKLTLAISPLASDEAPWSGEEKGAASYRPASDTPLSIARGFDGKIEAPALTSLGGASIARWDLAQGISGGRIVNVAGNGLDGSLANRPLRAVTGHRWDGATQDWRQAPDQYAAIHFHSDDLADAAWRPSFAWDLPRDMPSGVYAVRLEKDGAQDRIPFFVRPRDAASAPLAFLAPTATYLAYTNDHQALDKPAPEIGVGRPIVLQPQDLHLHLHRELGLSLYDRHADGGGVHHASRLRPSLTMRPAYRRWDGADGLGHRWFALDLQLVGWLHRAGITFDVITDEDLDREGIALLTPYRAVLTGNQPEYTSSRMLDALDAFVVRGGRLVALGGNEFYWPVAYDPAGSGAIELRRGNDAAGPWESEPGEAHFSTTGEGGGTWRTLGRPAQKLTGVGFVAEGFTRGGPYERLPASDAPEVAFVFRGVENRRIGSRGFSGGGAAGIELDRTDAGLGTPPQAIVLARAAPPSVFYAPDVLEIRRGTQDSICAEMVFVPQGRGGAVFATGSIAWIGALAADDDVSRITRNVIERFLDPAPFA